MCEAPIMLRQILALQILVGTLMVPDFLSPQFLYQAVLVSSVVALHPTFGLRGIGRDNSNPQPLTHLPELRRGHLAAQQLLLGRLFDIHRLPIFLQSYWHSISLDPTPQHSRRGPDRFLYS